MRIQVLYFAVLRERVGATRETIELAAGACVRDAIAALGERHAAIAELRARFRVAVNEAFAADDEVLADGDEVALIPPVAGGADGEMRASHVALRDDGISLDRCVAAVSGGDVGAIVTFTGVVRRHSRGHEIEHLEYEAYAAMALRELAAVCAEIEAEFVGARVAVEHRVGRLAVGELAVVIAAGAPHRAEAFAACRALIDRLKERVPIWKKEVGDGGEEWIGIRP